MFCAPNRGVPYEHSVIVDSLQSIVNRYKIQGFLVTEHYQVFNGAQRLFKCHQSGYTIEFHSRLACGEHLAGLPSH